ncbi:MAG: ISAzo13 family transposase, partial [Bacteroidetes bacterium]|nr:ISAzo13 family transposase [Bacteroidota bacterium]
NPIEHRLFSPISCNWAGRPLDSWETMLNYIRTTTNKSGLRVDAVRVTKQYQTGVKISKEQMAELKLTSNKILPKWNYDIYPNAPMVPTKVSTETCISEPR